MRKHEEEAPLLSCLDFHFVPARKEWRDVGLGTPGGLRETVRLQALFRASLRGFQARTPCLGKTFSVVSFAPCLACWARAGHLSLATDRIGAFRQSGTPLAVCRGAVESRGKPPLTERRSLTSTSWSIPSDTLSPEGDGLVNRGDFCPAVASPSD